MQTEEALERVAYEMIEDMHEDGVVYVETRFAPISHWHAMGTAFSDEVSW